MSSNNHSTPMITRDNYEEFFLLYVDDELTTEQKKAVDDFILLHPDLKEELDLLCSTKLPAEKFVFENKTELLADNMKETAVDESLLLYIDNELPEGEAAKVAEQLKKDEAFALQYQLLLKTKLDKTEQIRYPNKKELYRRTERRLAPVWLRVAAAVAVLVSGTTVWMNMDHSKSLGSVAIVTPKNPGQQATPVTKKIELLKKDEKTANVAVTKKNQIIQEESPVASVTTVAKHSTKINTPATFSKPHTMGEGPVASNHLPVEKAKASGVQPDDVVAVSHNAFTNSNSTVTPKVSPTYIPKEATSETVVPSTAVATTDNERESGGMKGLLRKATRFIERRTGIKAVNDDNELLAGPVAVKL